MSTVETCLPIYALIKNNIIYEYSFSIMSITAPQDAHKRLVLQIVEWLTDLLSGYIYDL